MDEHTKAIQELTKEVQRLKAITVAQQRIHVRHGWLKFVIHDLETNPKTQYKVHLYGAIYWLINFPLIACLFFFAPGLWVKLGVFITLVYSIYANFATDYGAMSSALAVSGSPLPEIPLESKPVQEPLHVETAPVDPGTSGPSVRM